MVDTERVRQLIRVLDGIIHAGEGDTRQNDWEKINAAKAELGELMQADPEAMLPYILSRGRVRGGLLDGLKAVDDPTIQALIPYWTKPLIKADLANHPPTPPDPDLTAYLLKKLESSDAPPRWIYHTLLEVADESATQPLLDRLESTEDEKLQDLIHEILANIGGVTVTGYYLGLLETAPSSLAIRQLAALAETRALPRVYDLLATSDSNAIKGASLHFLTTVSDAQTLEIAHQFAMNADEAVVFRKRAVQVIETIGGSEALTSLKELEEVAAGDRKLLRAVKGAITRVSEKLHREDR